MNLAVKAELRLVEVIREARALVVELNALKHGFQLQLDQMPKSEKLDRQFLKEQISKISIKVNMLKQQIESSHSSVNAMHGNLKWKSAMLALYGEAGVSACLEWFALERKSNNPVE